MNSAKKHTVTVTVTGAAGQIGYASLFRIAAGEMLGPDTPVRLRLLEIPAGLQAAEGVALELTDCAFPLLESIDISDQAETAFEGANLALLIGSRPRTKGMERADLLEANGGIFSTQGRAINERAADDIKVLVVGNPANTNALIAASHAPDVPSRRFTALTRLDHQRALAQLATATASRPQDIEGLAIWGNHSASQYPDLFQARIGERPALDLLAERGLGQTWIEETFIPTVAQRGAEIIAVRGASSAASAANAAIAHMRDWVLGTQGKITSMAVPSDGSYGVPQGLISSFPVTCADGDYRIVQGLDHSDFARARIEASVAELAEEREAVANLGLLGA